MKRILFQFKGGAFDGLEYASDSEDPDVAYNAKGWYFMTHEGKEGKEFITLSPAAIDTLIREGPEKVVAAGARMNHKYRVTGKTEDDTHVLVIAEFVGYSEHVK